MTSLFSTVPSLATDATLLAIADAIVKATLLLGAAAVAAWILRSASAATRHLIWTLALCAALAVPALSFVLPRWELPVLTIPTTTPAPESIEATSSIARVPAARSESSESAVVSQSDVPVSTPPLSSPSTVSAGLSDISWQSALVVIWLVGVIAVSSRLVIGLLAVAWMSRRTERVATAPWLPLARQLAKEIGVNPGLTFLRSTKTTMPMAWGILEPAVLMPTDADDWPLDRLRIVLLHELAHVKRRDCLTHAIAQAACAIHWFNPLSWIAARHARSERERACDDLVLAAGTPGADYADELLAIARVMRTGRFPALLTGATLAMAHRSQLEGRLIAILDPKIPRTGLSRIRAAATTAVVACALVPVASIQPWVYAHSSTEGTSLAKVTEFETADQTSTPTPTPSPRPLPRPAPRPTPADPDADLAHAAAHAATQAVKDGVLEGVIGGTVEGAMKGVLERLAERGVDHAGGQGKPTDPRLIEALTAALKDSDVEVRESAMHALAQLRDPIVFEPIVQALSDPSVDVREQAAFALGQLRDPRAMQPLINALKDANGGVREHAAMGLGQLRDARAVPALSAALKDEDEDVREQAAFALGQLGERSAAGALAAALGDPSDQVREQVVFALGQLRDSASVDGLAKALRDQKPSVREQAAFALGQIRDPKAVSPLISALKDSDASVREQAAFALGQLRDSGAVEALNIALKDSSASVREQVAFALGQIGDPRAIEGLTAALKDPNTEVRRQAAFALGQLAR